MDTSSVGGDLCVGEVSFGPRDGDTESETADEGRADDANVPTAGCTVNVTTTFIPHAVRQHSGEVTK